MASTINASTSSGIVTSADNSGQLELQTGNTTAITVNSSQNVGIGTTSPNVKLDVIGSIEASAAATQDAIILAGRAGGSSSRAVTLTPTTLTASRTVTLPDADINFANGLGVAQGGTGQTTYTNGQLLIGNTTGNTLTKATLTAGSGITVTNGTGSITIAATGGGGFSNMQVFASPGTFTTPASTTNIKVTVVGGGGGGRAGNGVNTGGANGAGGGGAIYVGPVSASTPYAVTVGSGGPGGPSAFAAGGTGGTSSFGPLCSATGGAGGSGPASTASGGIGTTGTLLVKGGNASGPTAVGTIAGTSMLGSGGVGGSVPLISGGQYGGGGGFGAASPNPNVGGAGAGGVVIVEW